MEKMGPIAAAPAAAADAPLAGVYLNISLNILCLGMLEYFVYSCYSLASFIQISML